jgi:hypothetical protein
MAPAPAPHPARTSAALAAVAELRPGAELLALILALLLRLLARCDAAWASPEDEDEEEYEDDCGFDRVLILAPLSRGPALAVLYWRPVGRAPHAAAVEHGLVADWILPGIRNRGMRTLPRPAPPPRPARTPPPEPAPAPA